MKRRQADGAKLRRPLKRNKIADGIYSSTLLYLKFFLLWAIIILADFILEFRFEFLWPFWMLLRSVYDSFKYQGLAFSMFFVCIALTSDMICFFFIPVQWVFFAASTYVWVQYIWYTDKGICLPTMILCSVFIYMEAGVRLRDLRHMPAHLDLCRPFAAHCIGYPVVTLGFGFKSYVSYRMRKRKQQEVARENSFYMQLLQQALPPHEESLQTQPALKDSEKGSILVLEKTPEPQLPEKHMNGSAVHLNSTKSSSHSKKSDTKNVQHGDKVSSSSHHNHIIHNHSHTSANVTQISNFKEVTPEVATNDSGVSHSKTHTSQNHTAASGNALPSKDKEKETNSKMYNQMTQSNSAQNKHAQSNGVAGHSCGDKSNSLHNSLVSSSAEKHSQEHERSSSCVTTHSEKDNNEQKSNTQISEVVRSESDANLDKNVKGSLKNSSKSEKKESHTSQREERRKNKNKDKDSNKEKDNSDSNQKHNEHNKENDNVTRSSTNNSDRALRAALAAERQARAEITQLKQQNEQLSTKINSLNTSRQSDRSALAAAERRLAEERRARQAADARILGMHKSGECGWEWCRQRRSALEQEVNNMCDEMQQLREHNQNLTQSLQAAEQQVNTLETRSRDSGVDIWHIVKSLRERIVHLEHSLSAETRVKLDLFSAVGEAKRQLNIREDLIRTQEKEVEELKAKIAQMLAVMPNDSFSPAPSAGVSKLRLSDSGIACYPSHIAHHNAVSNSMAAMANNTNNANNMSNLDPNATAYTPKGTMQMPCSPAAEA